MVESPFYVCLDSKKWKGFDFFKVEKSTGIQEPRITTLNASRLCPPVHAFVSEYLIHLFLAFPTPIPQNYFWEWEYHDSAKNSSFIQKHLEVGQKLNPDPDQKNLFRKYDVYLCMTQFHCCKIFFSWNTLAVAY